MTCVAAPAGLRSTQEQGLSRPCSHAPPAPGRAGEQVDEMTSGIVFTELTDDELKNRIHAHEKAAKAMRVTFQDLRDFDRAGWMSEEERSLFEAWDRDRFLLGIDRDV